MPHAAHDAPDPRRRTPAAGGIAPSPDGPRPLSQDAGPTDEELDAFILTRLGLLGVDLSVLPEDDPDAPADRRRILASARRFLRTTPGAIADYELDALGPPPVIYPSATVAADATEGGGDA